MLQVIISKQKRNNKPTSASLRADPLPNSLWSLAGTRKWTKKNYRWSKRKWISNGIKHALLWECQFGISQGFNRQHKYLRLPVIFSNRDFPVESLGLVTCRAKTKTIKGYRFQDSAVRALYCREIFFNTNKILNVMQSFQNSSGSLFINDIYGGSPL